VVTTSIALSNMLQSGVQSRRFVPNIR